MSFLFDSTSSFCSPTSEQSCGGLELNDCGDDEWIKEGSESGKYTNNNTNVEFITCVIHSHHSLPL